MLLFCLQTTAGHIIIRKAKTVTGKIGRRLAHGRRCELDRTRRGKRYTNEDYIRKATYEEQLCLILCDGLGGHAGGK